MKKLLLIFAVSWLAGCSSNAPGTAQNEYPPPAQTPSTAASAVAPATSTPTPEATPIAKPVKTKSGLEYQLFAKGTGPKAKEGDEVAVHYTGRLANGTVFDSSRDRGEPIQFTLGSGQVIKGWDEGIAGMQVGEKRRLTIPADLAYGESGRPPVIPPGATLVFDVELMKIGQ